MIQSNISCVKYYGSPRALHVDGEWLSTMLFEILLGFKRYCIRFRKILQLPSGCFKGILPPWSPPDEEAKLSQFVPEVQKARRIRGCHGPPNFETSPGRNFGWPKTHGFSVLGSHKIWDTHLTHFLVDFCIGIQQFLLMLGMHCEGYNLQLPKWSFDGLAAQNFHLH